MTKDELTRREAEAWAAFEELVGRVPEERLETPALAGGWSVKDVLWHVAYWWGEFVRSAERNWADDEQATDDVNAREQARSRAMPFVEVRAEVDEARARLLEAWSRVDGSDAAGLEAFSAETVEHYEDHVPQLRALVEDPGVKARGV
ncbi:MAG: hypothetical protein KatS3mg013_2048 [Actinomycetota bacterium]|jgi:uncharacterized protein (TIGR03083 family)|nr:MAG: hypothetical protein KatS3mg013_2048 [Actinomycetota bacterium]